jgi:hypothetical protein
MIPAGPLDFDGFLNLLADLYETTALALRSVYERLKFGTVPGWLAAGSLWLAFKVFRRDRENTERAQVDLMGAWGAAWYVPAAENQENPLTPQDAGVKVWIRNASELPIEVAQLAYEVHTTWMVPETKGVPQHDCGCEPFGVSKPVSGRKPLRKFVPPFRVPPQETVTHESRDNVDHTVPTPDAQRDPINSPKCVINWLLLIDNAGRKWEVMPGKGGRAKRVGRRWKPKEYQPREW